MKTFESDCKTFPVLQYSTILLLMFTDDMVWYLKDKVVDDIPSVLLAIYVMN